MASITLKSIDTQADWDTFLASHPESNFLQSWQWGQFHAALKKPVYRQGFYQADRLVGVMLSVVEPARRGRYLTVPGGPIINWHDKAVVTAFVKAVSSQARIEKCVFVRVRPQLLSDDFSRQLFAGLGFRSAPIHMHAELTHQLDITRPEDELLAGLRKGTRYELKKAGKEGIVVTTSSDPADIPAFYDIQIDTSKRQGFVPFSLSFLLTQFKTLAAADQALLFTASLDGQLLAQAFIIMQGQEAVYHYGASTDAGRKHPGAYLIQWEAIKEAKRRGLTRYNFWGVAPPDKPQHGFAGVSIFKRGFGGGDIQYLHAHDLVINRPHYLFNLLIEETRRRIRRV